MQVAAAVPSLVVVVVVAVGGRRPEARRERPAAGQADAEMGGGGQAIGDASGVSDDEMGIDSGDGRSSQDEDDDDSDALLDSLLEVMGQAATLDEAGDPVGAAASTPPVPERMAEEMAQNEAAVAAAEEADARAVHEDVPARAPAAPAVPAAGNERAERAAEVVPRQAKNPEDIFVLPAPLQGCSLRFNRKGFIRAHCGIPGHGTCTRQRQTLQGKRGGNTSGRPIGHLLAWLAEGAQHDSHVSHVGSFPASHEARQAQRDWFLALEGGRTFAEHELPAANGAQVNEVEPLLVA